MYGKNIHGFYAPNCPPHDKAAHLMDKVIGEYCKKTFGTAARLYE
jgi:hypothetical protein